MKVFVYGSLRHNQGNSRWMSNAQKLGSHCLMGYEIYDLGHYPAVVRQGSGELYGEVYRIDASILQQLDQLKNVPCEYRRELISTPCGKAWIYLYQYSTQHLKRIPSGDWLQRGE